MAESYTRLRSRLLKIYTYLMILSVLRSLSIRKSASVNTCFCSVHMISRLDSQSKFQMLTLFSGRYFPAAILVAHICGLCKFLRCISTNIFSLGKRTGTKLGEVFYLFIWGLKLKRKYHGESIKPKPKSPLANEPTKTLVLLIHTVDEKAGKTCVIKL